MEHKAGFVNIVGNPNVGKSTLMNGLVGEKLSIITSKMQTTRHRIKGIVNGDDFQIVYSDTPGILKPNYQLQESMMKFVDTAFQDADVILYVTDTYETAEKNMEYVEKLQKTDIPVIVVINKVDLTDQDKLADQAQKWADLLPLAQIIPVSAKEKFNLDVLFKLIMREIPVSPPFFSKDELTDKNERFFAQEIIREKILMQYKQEIPYSVEVEIEEFKDEPELLRLSAIIYVNRDTQKGIIIGHKGRTLKYLGTDARKDMEEFFDKKVFLQMYVKVRKGWRESEQQLRQFGYDHQ